MDEPTQYQLPHARNASEEEASHSVDAGITHPLNEIAPTEEEVNILRAKRDALEAEQQASRQATADYLAAEEARRAEVIALRREVADLLRERDANAGVTPTLRRPLVSEPPLRQDTPGTAVSEMAPSDSASQVSTHVRAMGTKRKRFRDPKPYKGDTLKEATLFLKSLQTIFKIDPVTYETDEDRVLYASTWLTAKPEELWAEDGDDKMTWEEFETFIMDCVADPVNRSLDVGQSYEDARQKEGESVSSFAMHLSTLESQFHDSYTEAQRTRHLFNKLRNNIREAISLKADIPTSRKELVAMAGRLENAQKPRSQYRANTGDRRNRDAGGSSSKKKKGRKEDKPLQSSRPNDDRPKPSYGGKITCYNCGKDGHKSTECRSPKQNGSAPHATRKVGVTGVAEGSMAPPPRKSLKKGRGQAAGARFSLT